MAFLKVIKTPEFIELPRSEDKIREGDRIPLSLQQQCNTSWVIGRNPDCCTIVVADQTVSRLHCVIGTHRPIGTFPTRQQVQFLLQDLNSRGGTHLNNHSIANRRVALSHNDLISLGRTELQFVLDDTERGSEPEDTITETDQGVGDTINS